MNWLNRLFSRERMERDLDKELRFHFESQVSDKVRSGIPEGEARRLTRLEFGGTDQIKEDCREARGTFWMESASQDVRYAMRQLRNSPGFTITAVLILALGIGAVTAVFSLIDAALLKMLPVQNPEQLVEFKAINPKFPVNEAFSYPTFKTLQDQTQAFAGVFAFRRLNDIDVEVDGRGGLAAGQLVSGSYFTVLGVKAVLGRTILPVDESAAGQNPVTVIGYDYWRTRFASDPNIVGKHLLLNNVPFTIVGVTQPEFFGVQPGERVEVSVPLTMIGSVYPGFANSGGPADCLKAPFRNWLHAMGRLQSGISAEKATASLQPVFSQSMRDAAASLAGLPVDSAEVRQAYLNTRLQLEPGSQGLASLRRQYSKPLWILMTIVGLLLLITCANVANLLLARASAREREFAVRLALGAGKGRLIRQLLTEGILLSLIGGVLGVGLAYGGNSLLLALMAHGRNPASLTAHPDPGVLGFALAVSLITAVIFGTIPALRATDVDPSNGLAQGARNYGAAANRFRLGKSLVVLQVAISLVLMVGAGLLTRTLANLKNFQPGFDRENVLLFSVDPTVIGYKEVVPLYERLLVRLRALPGVRMASLSVHSPLSTNVSTTNVKVLSAAEGQKEDLAAVNIEPVGPNYFTTMGIPLLRGRDFSWDDRDGTTKVAIVSESMARHYFGNADPIGQFVSIPGFIGDASWIQIVGEIRDIKVHDLRESDTVTLFPPLFQLSEGGATFEVRTAMDPAYLQTTVLDAVRAIDPRLPVYAVKTLDVQLNESLVEEQLVGSLSGLFAILGLVLTCVGLFGLMAYTVQRRTSEIGIRMAMGAERVQIARMILRETLVLTILGLSVGVSAAAFATRLIASQLFGLKPWDPITFSAACLVMTVVMMAASYIPARRAASVDPMRVLRSE
jgi:predicted permease